MGQGSGVGAHDDRGHEGLDGLEGGDEAAPDAVAYPGARGPDRVGEVDAHGIHLSVKEWGDADAPPVALMHGGFDFARTFDVLAPLLADAGWRVVSWDQRGHGDSDQAALYSWEGDLRDAAVVVRSVSPDPIPVIGHSKGGSVLVHLASTLPHLVSRLVNLDGLPSRRAWPEVPDHMRTKIQAGELATWLDVRRGAAEAIRKPGTIAELAARRGRMNPRLSPEWLEYLVSVGARLGADGWRWKIDPTMRMGGFGPFRPEWSLRRLALLSVPVLAVLATEPEVLGWSTLPEDVEPYLPPGGKLVALDGVGHFVHVEQPHTVAAMVLDFLGEPARAPHPAPAPALRVRHNKVELALHRLRDGTGRPLLALHGLGERSPAAVPAHLANWPGPIWALDFTGHGASTVPVGGGYFAELLMGDVDAALSVLGEATLYGRGLGAYAALLAAGARHDMVRGAILDDGPGLAGGGTEPGSATADLEPARTPGPPDPYALRELSRDIRPPDYATSFARLATTLSGLDVAIALVGSLRPPWLGAVAGEPGVQVMSRDKALALFA
jgi:pimeloyl-ACP methyl ester carboxylesterase